MTTDIASLKANIKRWTLILAGSPNHDRLYGRIHPAFSRGVVSRYRDGAHRVHRQWRLDGGIRLPSQGTPAGSGGIEGMVRDATNWHWKFPPPGGTDNPIASGSLKLCGVTMMVALLLTLYGLLRSKTSSYDSNP